jgi:polysaccharide biosynthesis protein PslJ
VSASTGHLRPASAGEARRRALALALPVLGVLALIATLPLGGAAIALGSGIFAGTCMAGLLLAPRPERIASTAVRVKAPLVRAVDAVEAPARAVSLVIFVAIVWFIPIRVYTLPAPGPVKLEPYRLYVILLGIALLYGAVAGTRRIRACGVGVPLVALTASAVVSLIVNYSDFVQQELGTEAIKQATYLLTFPIVFVLVASGVNSRADIERVIKAIVLGGAVVAACAIVETRTGYNVFNHLRDVFPFLQDTGFRATEVRNGALRAEASAQHPIALGVALSLCMPLALALTTRVRGTLRRVVFGGAALILTVGMVATISRTAFLGLAVMLLIGLMYERRRLFKLWPLLFVMLIGTHTVLPGGLGRLYNAFFPKGGITAQQSVRAGDVGSGRLADISPALKLVQSHAYFGTGDPLPPPPDLATETTDTGNAAAPVPIIFDDQYLTSLVGHGFLGLGIVLWLLGAILRRLMRASRRARGELPLLSACTACVAGFAASMLTFDAFAFVQCSIFFFMIAALGLRLAHLNGLDYKKGAEPDMAIPGGDAIVRDRAPRPLSPAPALPTPRP